MSNSSLPSNPTSQTVAALLPKLHDADPDYRFMSLNDLFQVLTIGRHDFLHSDYNTAARAVDGIIKTLDDQNGEVQNLAIKCLSPLVTKVPSTIIAPMIEKLSTLTTENSVDNSVPALALRAVVTTLPRPVPGVAPTRDVNEAYAAVSRVLIPRLIGHLVLPTNAQVKLPPPPSGMLQANTDKDIDSEAVDVLIEVVRCFGPMLQVPEVEALHEVVVGILESERATSVVKKRAVVAASILAVYLSDETLSAFVSHIIECFRNPHLTPMQRRMYLTILGSMARSIPQRFGNYLKMLAPFVLTALSQQELDEQLESAAEEGESDPEADSVRESALVALDGFLASCGNEMRTFTDETIAAALRFLKYDPNYANDEDEDMEASDSDDDDMEGLDDDEDFEAEDGFDDADDDASWKVRRCAAKVLYTLISTRGSGDLLEDGTLYRAVAPVLISRFNEREENVRLEIIATMSSLIKKTGEGSMIPLSPTITSDFVSQPPASRKRRRESSTVTFDTKPLLSQTAGLASPTIEPLPSSGPKADLGNLTPAIIKAAIKLLKGKTIPTKQALITLLDNMVSVQHGGLSDYFAQLVDPVVDAVKGSGLTGVSSSITTGGAASVTSTTLRIAALHFIGDVCETHSSNVLQPYLEKLIPGVVQAVKDKFYKISAEAIGTVEQLVKALTPPRSLGKSKDQQPYLNTLYRVIIDRVSANDADLEVRQRAMQALGILLARTAGPDGSKLVSTTDRMTALDILKERLKNETTRIAAVRAIDTVAALTTTKEQLQADWIREVALELSAQLRKANRSLRGASLGALKNLIVTPAARSSLDTNTIVGLVSALLPLLTTEDLHMLGPALLVLAALVEDESKVVVTDELNKALVGLLVSPLGGAVLDALLILVANVGKEGRGAPLMKGLLQEVGVNGDPAVIGKVIGTLLVSGSSSVGVTIDSFLGELKNKDSGEAQKSLALAVLGEAGLRLGSKSPLEPEIFISQFTSSSDKVSLAAAVALGRAGAGNIQIYLPVIMQTMDNSINNQFLLLHSIKEVLQQAGASSTDMSPFTQNIWTKLLAASQTEENKAIGAECIGRLAVIDPKTYIPQLQACLQDKSSSLRAMVIQAIRYTLPDSDEAFDAFLKTVLIELLTTMLHDSELENRRLALTTLNSAAHNKPDLIIPHLSQLLPLVMEESVIKPELVREVMMGPFKHKVDDGLEVRKSAYETLYSLMETAFSRINRLDFFDRVIQGLSDDHDIRALCSLMLTKLVVLDPDETLRRLDSIAQSFRYILSIKLKDNAVKQEVEKQDEAVKSVLRVTLLLQTTIPTVAGSTGAGQHQFWQNYWEWVEKDFDLQLKGLREESREAAINS